MTEPLGPLAALGGTRWLLVEVGGKLVSEDDDRAPHLVLDLDELRASGSGGRNRLMGSIELAEDALHFRPIATTLMDCRLEGSTLTLLDGARVLARFEAATAVAG